MERKKAKRAKLSPGTQSASTSPRDTGKLRYAVVGLGHIAQHAVLPAFAQAKKNSELSALISDSDKKLTELGKQYGVEQLYHYEDLERCVQEHEIDALYIATPNTTHREFVLRGIEAGAHVLCEKPLSVTAQECRELDRAARDRKVYLMTAYRLHFDEANMAVVKMIKEGKIGEAKIFSSVFSFQVLNNNIRTSGSLGGGSLLDIGIYAVNAARYVFQAEPLSVIGSLAYGEDRRFKEVDGSCSAVLIFPDNKVAQFTSSFAAADSSYFEVVGTEGKLRLESAYEYEEGCELTIERKGKKQTKKFKRYDQFAAELVYFSDCVLQGKEPEPSAREGLADLLVLDAIRESSLHGEMVAVREVIKKARPDNKQIITRSWSRKNVPLIKVSSPHQN